MRMIFKLSVFWPVCEKKRFPRVLRARLKSVFCGFFLAISSTDLPVSDLPTHCATTNCRKTKSLSVQKPHGHQKHTYVIKSLPAAKWRLIKSSMAKLGKHKIAILFVTRRNFFASYYLIHIICLFAPNIGQSAGVSRSPSHTINCNSDMTGIRTKDHLINSPSSSYRLAHPTHPARIISLMIFWVNPYYERGVKIQCVWQSRDFY